MKGVQSNINKPTLCTAVDLTVREIITFDPDIICTENSWLVFIAEKESRYGQLITCFFVSPLVYVILHQGVSFKSFPGSRSGSDSKYPAHAVWRQRGTRNNGSDHQGNKIGGVINRMHEELLPLL